jgi:hypothetical protein
MVDGFRERSRKAPYLPAGAAVRKMLPKGLFRYRNMRPASRMIEAAGKGNPF